MFEQAPVRHCADGAMEASDPAHFVTDEIGHVLTMSEAAQGSCFVRRGAC